MPRKLRAASIAERNQNNSLNKSNAASESINYYARDGLKIWPYLDPHMRAELINAHKIKLDSMRKAKKPKLP